MNSFLQQTVKYSYLSNICLVYRRPLMKLDFNALAPSFEYNVIYIFVLDIYHCKTCAYEYLIYCDVFHYQANISGYLVQVTDTDDVSGDIDEVMADAETEDALAEFDFLVSENRDRLGRESNSRNNPDMSQFAFFISSVTSNQNIILQKTR